MAEGVNKSFEGLASSKEELKEKLKESFILENVNIKPLFSEVWKRVHPAIDAVDGVAYIGVDLPCEVTDDKGKTQLRNFHFLIKSDGTRILCHREVLAKEKLQLAHSVVRLPNRWSLESVKAWLDGSAKVEPNELYIAVKTSFETYIEFEDSRVYDFLTLWSIGTYLYHLFNSYPYLNIHGMKQTGKTKLDTLLSLICFNAIFSNNISTASAYRLVQSGRCTLIMDETEKLRNPEREIDFRNMLYAGYKKGAVVYRTHKDTLKPELFEVYSPKVVTNIKGIEDVLEDRCITIIMKRGKNLNIVNAEIPFESQVWQQIRDMLYIFYLSYFHEVCELSEQVNLLREGVFQKLKQRELEIWKPILTLAMFFDKYFNGLFNEMCEFAESKSEEKFIENMTETLDYVLVQTLNSLVEADGFYKVKAIKEAMASNFDEPQKWLTTKWIGNALRRLGFTEKRRFGSGYEYFLSKSKVKDLAERLGVSESASPSKFTYAQTSLDSSPEKPLTATQTSLTKENFESVFDSLIEAGKSRGSAHISEIVQLSGLPKETVEAVLKLLERGGKAYSPYAEWWKVV